MGYVITKRAIDCTIALLALLLLSPIMIGLLLTLRGITRRNPVFTQARVGYQERIFVLYKIRTMYPVEVFDRTPMVAGFCRFLRQYSVDEIPQLWNVIMGDMSLIGPRPLLVEYLPYYSDQQRKRHWVKPGITGLAQVHGRNLLGWPKKFALDTWYVDNASLSLDTKILLRTLVHLAQPTGVRSEGLAEFEKFRGSPANS